MRMSIETYNRMNSLMQKCFNANSVIDNLAYNLDYFYYNRIAKVVHLRVAHMTPEWADMISDKMLELSARPVRKDINGYDQEIQNVEDVFKVLLDTLQDIRIFTKELIEESDMEGDDEVRIFSEEFLIVLSPYIKQAEEWINAVQKIGANDLNIHIDDYTHFIK